jgi:Pro-kumamolisin, activation domain/IPT/TIG domain
MARMGRAARALLCCVGLVSLALAVPADAADRASVATIHVRPIVASGQAAPVGPLPPSQRLRLSLALPLRDPDGLKVLLPALADPRSPHYRQYLSVQDFTDRYGPSEADYDAVLAFARANNMTVTDLAPNRMLVDVDASVGDIERAFHLRMGLYRHPTENRLFYAPDREPSADLSVTLWHIGGLDDYAPPRPALAARKASTLPRPMSGSAPDGSYMASDMRAAYYGAGPLTGTGQSVGLVEFGGYWQGDVDLYYSTTGTTSSVPVTNVLVDDGANCPSACEDDEEAADIVQAAGTAPGLTQVIVYTGGGETPDADILNRMATDNIARQLSVSWTWTPEDPASDDPIFQEMAAQGQSIFVASGDCGAYAAGATEGCDGGAGQDPALFPAEDAYVTAVGGTALTTSGPGGGFVAETAWSGSGGGYAAITALPSYQANVANAANNASTTLRNVPDVAADAIPDSYYCTDGACDPGGYVLGGTSLATPRWAGFMALVNEQAALNGAGAVGFFNPTVYALGQGGGYQQALHDTTSGSNTGFSAVPDYDLVTGWGSPNGNALVEALAGAPVPQPPPAVATISPASGPLAGGNSVTITGANLAGTTSVTFGAVPAARFVIEGAGRIIATAPAGGAGTVDLRVTTAWGTSPALAADRYVYNPAAPPAPMVSALSPTTGPVAGGNAVVITGANLAGATSVAFGGVPATNLIVYSATQVIASAPAGSAGWVDVTVTTPGGTSALATGDAYAYPAPPVITALSPSTGPTAGGTAITITGINLTGATAVSFGGVPAPNLITVSDGVLVVTAPSGVGGPAAVTVSANGGDSGPSAEAQYVYQANLVLPVAPLGASGNFIGPESVAVDGAGNVFVADLGENLIKEILAAGGYTAVNTIAAATYAMNQPFGVALDGQGNLFIADTFNNAVEEVPAAGGYASLIPIAVVNGLFIDPTSLAVDRFGNVFVADWGNNAIKEIVAAGGYVTVNTVATGFNHPYGIALDSAGNLFVADAGNNAIEELSATSGYSQKVSLAPGNFYTPYGVAVDGSDNVYVADTNDSAVKEIQAEGGYRVVTELAPGSFSVPAGLALDASGNVFVADTGDNAVKEIVRVPAGGTSPLAAAILPGARSVRLGTPATMFATVLNGSANALQGCGIALPSWAPAGLSLSYQTTDPATNGLTGTANQPVSIPANGARTFLLALQSATPDEIPGLAPQFACAGTAPAAAIQGVDTVDLDISQTPVADIIALGATATGDGILHLGPSGGAFAVATINLGAAAPLSAEIDTGAAALPVTMGICQTTAQGQCLAPPTASVPITIASGATPTFSVFVGASAPIPLAPAASRLFVRFYDAGGQSHGATSVAVTTN